MNGKVKLVPTVLAIALITALLLASGTHAAPGSHGLASLSKTKPERPRLNPDRILVKPKHGVAQNAMEKLHASHGAKTLRVFKGVGNLQVVKVAKNTNVRDVLAKYRKSGLVEYAEPDYLVKASVTPNDTWYLSDTQWGLHNTGQDLGTPDADIDAPEAWDVVHDTPGVTVAVIDTGICYTHPDLAANIWTNPDEIPGNGLDDDANGWIDDVHGINPAAMYCDQILFPCSQDPGDPMDDNGHGTHCAGIIGAVGNNAEGVVGVAWNVKIMACKFLDWEGYGYSSDAIACIEYARAEGADVMNCSWGGGDDSEALRDTIAACTADNIVFACAAGNEGMDNDSWRSYPASFDLDNIISVAATDRNDAIAEWSNYGSETVDLAAPGVDVYSTYYDYIGMLADYAYMSGTSMATPYVAGSLALLKSLYPNDNVEMLVAQMLQSVDVIPSMQGKCTTNGRLNLQRVVTIGENDLWVLPGTNMQFGGMSGGPFNGSITYKLVNHGTSAFDWSATTGQNWLAISPASGTLLPGQSLTASVSINANGYSLPDGLYTDTVAFTNLTNGSGTTTRQASLTVGAVRVSTTGDNANNGTTWSQAKRTVQAAIDSAMPGQEIWVAAGTYVENLYLKAGILLFGGFAGTETQRSQRNWTTNVTILDGDYWNHVIFVDENATPATRIDGLTLRHGLAYYGAGVFCGNGSPTIANCIVTENETVVDNYDLSNPYGGCGGGIYSIGSPVIVNNVITRNRGSFADHFPQLGGGGIYACYGAPVIANNTITQNCAEPGGGIYCAGANATVKNNIIAANAGGAIYCSGASPAITNNTIVSNAGAPRQASDDFAWAGGGITCIWSSPTVVNNIIAHNSSGVYVDSESTPINRNNDLFGNTEYGWAWANYQGGDIYTDPKLAGYAYGNIHIQADSPCRSAGDSSVVQAGDTDMDGQARIQGTTVDIGADESDGTSYAISPVIVRVSPTGSDANDGSSWALAKQTIQAAIDAAAVSGGEVWVKAGTYNGCITLKPFVYLYGGFAGTETARTQRNWKTNVSIIDGQQAGTVVTANVFHMLSTVDGFTIRNGSNDWCSGGIYSYYSSMPIANNTITGNTTYQPGGGIGAWFSYSTITGNTITGNSTNRNGGGIYLETSKATVNNNVIKQNTATYLGGGVQGWRMYGAITGNVIASNSTPGSGGGISLDESPNAVITSNTLVSNTATTNGGGIMISHSGSVSIANNIIAFGNSGICKGIDSYISLRCNDLYGNTAYNYSGCSAGTGDLALDPGFVDRVNGNYHLTSRSRILNKGYNNASSLPATDMDGQGRIYNNTVDIGADEYWP